MSSSDSESDISGFYEVLERVEREFGGAEGHDSSGDEVAIDGIQPYRFEPEASDTDEEAQPADHARAGPPVPRDIDRLQNTEW